MEGTVAVVKNPEILSPTYVPDRLLHRDKEIDYLSFFFEKRAVLGHTPPHILITGPPGCGKTAVTMHLLDRYRKRIRGKTSFVRATESSFRVLRSVSYECGVHFPRRGISFKEGWDIFNDSLKGELAIIILDELDKTLRIDGDTLLYELSRRPKTCVIGISNYIGVLDLIGDARVRSSFNPRKFAFPPYNPVQLEDILTQRVKLAGANATNAAIRLCAALAVGAGGSSGDARFALDLLSFGAELAEREDAAAIEEKHVRRAKDEVEKMYMLRSLEGIQPREKKLLLHTIFSMKSGSPTAIYEKTTARASAVAGFYAYTFDRLSDFLRELELEGWVSIRRKGRRGESGGGVQWLVETIQSHDPNLIMPALEQLLKEPMVP